MDKKAYSRSRVGSERWTNKVEEYQKAADDACWTETKQIISSVKRMVSLQRAQRKSDHAGTNISQRSLTCHFNGFSEHVVDDMKLC